MAALLFLITSLALSVLLTRAKVVNDFQRGACEDFFYKKLQPRVTNCRWCNKICQTYNDRSRFATLYNPNSRIPVYSAYKYEHSSRSLCEGEPNKRRVWFVEPQVTNRNFSNNMAPEISVMGVAYMQAVNEDYVVTSYDRGHLNPSSYHCDEERTATFTLTNAVPLDRSFNGMKWSKYQNDSQYIVKEKCPSPSVAYFITGAIPSKFKIPIDPDDALENETRAYDRVTIPDYVWSAVCCDHVNRNERFSFGYIGKNIPGVEIRPITIEHLERELARLYSYSRLSLFTDTCNGRNSIAAKVIAALITANVVTYTASFAEFPQSISPSEQKLLNNNLGDIYSGGTSSTRTNVDSIRIRLKFDSNKDWFDHVRVLRNESGLACVHTDSLPGSGELASQTAATSCILEEQRHNQNAVTAHGIPCRPDFTCGIHDQKYSWCYTSYSKHWEHCCTSECTYQASHKGYMCMSDIKWVSCSPAYSMMTVSGRRCRFDFPCGSHSKNYFWCYTDINNNWEYCCAPDTYCHKNGTSFDRCYVDVIGKKHLECRNSLAPSNGLE
ncbi:unnamed protein product [Lampetra planeri]